MPFDPFSDRMARDIRNSLSSALVAELTGRGRGSVAAAAERWLAQRPAAVYRMHVEEQLRRYHRVLADIRAAGMRSVRRQAVFLWNAGLYFELHELLETIWKGTVGPESSALKGLIQAAGVYLHLQRGRPEAARNLARRARTHLQAGAAELAFVANLDRLIQALEQPEPSPLKLEIDEAQMPDW